MRSLAVAVTFAVTIAMIGCGDRTPLGDANADGGTDGHTIIASSPCSVERVTGSVSGVTISIRSDRCRYAVGESAKFTYEVTTDATLQPIVITASQGCGSCRAYGDDPLAFTSYSIGGSSADAKPQHYCVCDTGCCAPDQAQTIKVTPATKRAVIEWSGRNWYGPADTGDVEGAFFPPGSYGVHVSFGAMTVTLPFDIVP